MILDEVAAAVGIPQGRERDGLQHAVRNKDERPRRRDEWNEWMYELVVEPRGGASYHVQGSPAQDRRLVRRDHPRQLRRRQRALDEMDSLARQRPHVDTVVEREVVEK